jgi:hypothetical protein
LWLQISKRALIWDLEKENDMKRTRKRGMFDWLPGASVLICLMAIDPFCVEAHAPGVVLSGSGTAAIDGVMSPGEWNGAASIGFPANVPSRDGGGTTPATLFIMELYDTIGRRLDAQTAGV